MAGTLNVAFWNVQNLFELPVARQLRRGPRTQTSLTAKLDRLGSVVDGFFGNRGPDLFAVAEVGSRRLYNELALRLSGPYPASLRIWEGATMPTHTGLGLIGRDDRIAGLTLLDVWKPVKAARPRILLVECQIRTVSRPVWVVVNHWKSRIPTPDAGGIADWQDRLDAANWLGQRLGLASSMQCVIALGDFNCEPTEKPFDTLQFRGVRHATTAVSSAKAASTLYNSAWRFMADPDPWEHPRPTSYQASRPRTTWGDRGVSTVFDHLLVSKDALLGRPLSLREETVGYHPDPRVFRYNRRGQIRPVPWRLAAGQPIGASDHLPLLATFDIP